MLRARRERGLSEIVGFILILASIVIAVALYLTFGIPAQGREGEITHMDQVKDRFVELKINLDSLWSNRQCGTAIGTSFPLGTQGGATTGSFSIIPILAPAKTSATLALNQRAEYITISQDSYLMVDTGGVNETGIITTPVTLTFNTTPRYFFINITCPELLQKHGIHVQPTTGNAWEAWVNLTPVYTYSRRFNITNMTGIDWYKITGFKEWNESRWNRTDLTVSTWDGGIPVMQDMIVTTNATYPGNYIVDLMNPAYGISSDLGATLGPSTITASRSDGFIRGNFLTNYSYWPTTTSQSWTMGSLEYKAQNEYWIQQTYYYQLGGVFLEQDDGNIVKVPPAITFSQTATGIPVVRINEILLSGSGVIEGSSPVQVTSSVSDITDTRMATGNNTRSVNVSVRALSTNAAAMWLQVFNTSAAGAGFPTSRYTSGTAGIESFINISPDRKVYGVQLSLNKVTVNAAIQSAAPSVGG
ncbi:MAG TPA: hypothetical protein VMB35_03110 [Methanomicrobiales archaeon]|nr:hypothetical protein [Methanomicrobiales archaeon]